MNSTLERRSNGTYAPGVSGNPKGRPPGLSSFKTLADESQFSKRLFEILVAKCEEGDMQAIEIVADRLWLPIPRRTLCRLRERARRLHEREGDWHRLRQYVLRWQRWHWGGLDGIVSRRGGVERTWHHVCTHVPAKGWR